MIISVIRRQSSKPYGHRGPLLNTTASANAVMRHALTPQPGEITFDTLHYTRDETLQRCGHFSQYTLSKGASKITFEREYVRIKHHNTMQ